jgi:hypothetical protein
MSRSGYVDYYDWDGNEWDSIRWRGAVLSALRGSRGQAFLKEALEALDALPEKKLIANELEAEGQVCLLGAVGKKRGIDMNGIDPEDYYRIASVFGLARAMAQEIMAVNDDTYDSDQSPEMRYTRVRNWIVAQIAQ